MLDNLFDFIKRRAEKGEEVKRIAEEAKAKKDETAKLAEKEADEDYENYKHYQDLLTNIMRSSRNSLDSKSITISSSFLGLAIAVGNFMEADIVAIDNLYLSVVFLTCAVLLTLVSMYFSTLAADSSLKDVAKVASIKNLKKSKWSKFWNGSVIWLNHLQIIFLVAGIAYFAHYTCSNIASRDLKSHESTGSENLVESDEIEGEVEPDELQKK